MSSLEVEEEPQVRGWERFFKKYYRTQINEAVLGWPQRRSLTVDWYDLDKHDGMLAEFILTNPLQALAHAEEALKSVDVAVEPRPRLHVRVVHLPATSVVDVRALRAEHLGKLVALKGMVKRATEVRPKLQSGSFQCGRCGAFISEAQEEHLVLKEPLECYEDQGGCGRESSFKLVVSETRGQASRFVDTQKVELQEAPENMRGGEQPQRMTAFLEDDACSTTRPGERVTINGILRCNVKKEHGVKSTIFDLFVEVNSVERHEETFEDIIITKEDEASIRQLARDPEVYVKMRNSIAPSIHGLEQEKLVLLLQLFGGVEKHLPDKTRIRGDLHVLLVGDPGVAKSQLIRYMSGLAPRGIYTSGKSSSGAGLTAAAVQDKEWGDGRWTLEAGAMVLADRGLLCVDEIDKMEKNDQSSMHEGMEQQSISVAKAGITASLQSRCSVLGAANPKQGRFDAFTPIAEQINFPPALLSRFDVIFVLQDKPDEERDARLSDHVLSVHEGGAMLQQAEVNEASTFTTEAAGLVLARVEPPINRDFLRKYVAHAKRTCIPVLSAEAKKRLGAYYVTLRKKATATAEEDAGPMPLTVRQLEALVRLSEASARIRLSDHVTLEDADRAVSIYEEYMRRVGGGEGGVMDIDMVASGVSHSQRQAVGIVKDVIRNLEAANDHGAAYPDVVTHAEKRGVAPEQTQKIVERLKQQGELYTPREEHYRLLGGRS